MSNFSTGQIVRWKNPKPDESPEDRMAVVWCDRDKTEIQHQGFDDWKLKPTTIVLTSDLEPA